MSGKIKISLLTALFSFIASLCYAQKDGIEYVYNPPVQRVDTWCGIVVGSLETSEGSFNGVNYFSSCVFDGYRVKVYYPDSAEVWVDCTDEANEYKIFETDLTNSNIGLTAKLRAMTVAPKKVPKSWVGRTIRLELYFHVRNKTNGYVESIDMEFVGSAPLENGVDKSLFQTDPIIDEMYEGTSEAYVIYLCQGESLDMKINNKANAYGNTSFYENKYTAQYNWQVNYIEVSTYETYVNAMNMTGVSFTVDTLSQGVSKQYYFIPTLNVEKYTKEGTYLGDCSNNMTSYIVRYNSPLEQNFYLNASQPKDLKAVICDEEEFNVDFDLSKDGLPYNEVVIDLYQTDPISGVESLLTTLNGLLDGLNCSFGGSESVDGKRIFEALRAKNEKNTTYKYRAVVYDLQGDVWDQDSEGNWSVFTRERHCPVEFNFQVEVKETDAKIKISGDDEVCEDGTVALSAKVEGNSISDYKYSWKCDFAINADVDTLLTLSDENVSYNTGLRKYSFVVSNAGCEVESDPFEVIVNKRPVVTADAVTYSTCSDSEIEISVSCDQPDVTYDWTPVNGVLSADGSSMIVNTSANPLVVGTYSYSITAQNNVTGCTTRYPEDIEVTINGLPDVVAVSPVNPTICEGGTAVVTATLNSLYAKATPITYTWTWVDNGVKKTETNTNGQLQITPSETVEVEVSAVDKNGCESLAPFKFTVTVNMKPKFSLVGTDGCDGGSVSIQCVAEDGTPQTYEVSPMSGAPAGTLSGNVYTVNLASASLVSPVTYEYSVKAMSGVGCEDTKTIKLTVNPLPTVSLSSDKTTYCFGEEVELTASSAQSNLEYSWDDGVTYSSSKTTTKTVSTEGNQTFTVYARNKATGCVNTAQVSISVKPLPQVTITAADDEICEGTGTTLTASSAADVTYKWNNGETVNEINTGNLTANKTFKVVVTDKTTQCTAEAEYEVVVNKKPVLTVTVNPSAVCIGDNQTVELIPSVTNGVNVVDYTWDDASVTGTLGSYSITKTWTATETFEVVATSDKNCMSAPYLVTVKVNELPTVSLSADQADLKYCQGDEITFTAVASNVQYCWDGSKTNWVNNNTFTKSVTTGETFTVYVKDKTTGCINSASLTYEVNSLPTVTITPSTVTICEGDNVVLSATNQASFNYSWSTGETANEITVSPMTETTYTVTVYDVNTTCSIETESVVKVNKKPTFTVTAEPQNVCVGQSTPVKFTIKNTNGVPVSSYDWTDTDVTGSGETFTVSRVWSTAGVVTFEVVANSDMTPSCQSEPVEVSITVNALPELNTPTASPARICKDSGDEVTLSASVVSGSNIEYEWFEGVTSIGKGATIKVTPNTTTTYTVVARDMSTSAECESVEKTITVDVDNAPAKPEVSVSNNTYCSNETIDPQLQIVSPSADVTYKWYTSADVYVGEGATLSVSPTKTTSYYAVSTLNVSSGCQSEKSDLVEITINKAPVIEDVFGIAGVKPVKVCEAGGIMLMVISSNSNLTYTWTPDAITGMLPVTSDDSLYIANPIESGFVTVYATDVLGCKSNEVKYEIAVDKLPVVTIDPLNPNVCEGENVTIEVKTDRLASDVMISWEEKNVLASSWNVVTVADPSKRTFVPQKDMMYQVYASDKVTGCITKAVEVPVTIIDALQIELSNVNGGGQYCKDNDLSITASVANAGTYTYTYEWYYGGTKIADGATLNKNSIQIADAGIYKVVVKCNETGCVGELSQEIIVRDKIEVHIDDEYLNNMVCYGQPLELAIREEGTDYRWFVDGVELSSEKAQTLVYPTAGLSAGTKIKVKQILTSSTGCPSDEVEETYTILGDFSATLTLNDDGIACEDEELSYVIDVAAVQDNKDCYNNIIKPNCSECEFPNVASYELFVNNVGQGVVTNTFATQTIPYTALGMDDFSIYAKVQNIYGCEYTTPVIDVKVSNIAIDNISTTKGDTVYCFGNSDVIKVTASGAVNANYNYEFVVNGTSVQSSTSNELAINFDIVGTTNVKVIVTDVDASCVAETTVSYIVNDLPQSDLYVNGAMLVDGQIYSVCYDELIDLDIAGSDFVVEIDGTEVFAVDYHTVPGVATITPADVDLSSYFAGQSDIDVSDLSKLRLSVIGNYNDGDRVVRVKVTDPTTGCYKWSNAVTLHWADEITLSVPYPHEINTKLQLCLGETTTITASSGDVTSFTFTPEGGTPVVGTSYDVTASAIGTYMLTIQADNGCEKNVEIEVVAAPDPKVEVWTYNGSEWVESVVGADGYYTVCGSVPTKLIAKGASTYNMNITCDGENVVTDYAYNGDQFEYDFDSKFNKVSAGLSDFNEYDIHYDMMVGTCTDATGIKLKVYRLPDAKMNITPGTVVINGTQVTIDVTSGYVNYDFYLNDNLVQSGAESSYSSSSISETSTVRVLVTNIFGCSLELVDTLSILEGIAPKNVLQSSDYYCDDTDGITISIEEPQVGITYEVLGLTSGAAIKAEAGKPVEWTNVKILAGTNPTTYSVIAYHEALPAESVPMNNVVVVREVKVPTATKLLPYNAYVDVCNNGDVLQIEASEVGVQYVLFHEDSNGNITEVLRKEGNGGVLDLMTPNAKGKYTAISYGVNGDVVNLVCPVEVDGVYEYDIPEFELFTLTSNPSNGNICVGSEGAQLMLSGSEEGRIYSVYKDGNPYTVLASLDGTGNPLNFGKVFESGVYTVVCDYNSCSQEMDGSITVTLYEKPSDFEVTVSDNGYFCQDESFVKISVAGQQDTYIYRLMGYLDLNNPMSVTEVETYVGNNSGSAFTFATDIVTEGKYFVVVDIPDFESAYGSCSTVLGQDSLGGEFVDIKEVSINKPTLKVAKYEADEYITERRENIVVCETDFVDVIVGQTENKTDNQIVEYKLYCNDVYVDSRFDNSLDDNYVVFKKQPATSTVGVYKYHVVAEKKVFADGVEMKTCAVDYKGVVESTVEIIARPTDRNDGLTEVISVYVPAPSVGNCDPASVIVDNAQIGKVYRLYRLTEPGGSIIPSSSTRKVAESTRVVFNVEGQDDWYVVSVSNEYEIDGEMVKLCEDFLTPEQHVVDDRFLENHKIDLPAYVCHGDIVFVRMESSQVDVTYTLYKKTGETNGRPVGDYVDAKTATNTSGFIFDETITEDGIYFVEASGLGKCNTIMDGEFKIKFNSLPVSYELKAESAPGKRDDIKTYCVADSGVYVYLESSQDNVIYSLYNVRADGTLVFIESKEGDSGNEVQFNSKLVDADAEAEGTSTYIVSARNKFTNCTSNMKGRIEVLYMPEITTSIADATVELNNCNTEYTITLPESDLMQGALYSLVSVDANGNRIVVDSEYAPISGDIEFTISTAGEFEVHASYEEAACEKLVGTITTTEFYIEPQTLVYDVECDGNYHFALSNSQNLVDYVLNVRTIDDTILALDTVSGFNGTSITFARGAMQDVYSEFFVEAKHNDCSLLIDNVNVSDLEIYNTIPVAESFTATKSICSYDVDVFADIQLVWAKDATYKWTLDGYVLESHVSIGADDNHLFKYDSSRGGLYQLYASYDGKCETLVAERTLIIDETKTYNVSGNVTCDGLVTVQLSGSDMGVEYALCADSDTLETRIGDGLPMEFTVSSNVATPYTKFYVIAKSAMGCTYEMLGDVYNTKPDDILVLPFETMNEMVCDKASFVYTIEAPQAGVTYYILPDSVKTPVELTPMYTVKAVSSTPIDFNLYAGSYSVWASYDNFDCLTERWGVINVNSVTYNYYELTSNQDDNCEVGAGLTLTYSGSQEGVTYSLYKDGNPAGNVIGDGNALQFDVNGSGEVTYTLFASVDDKCEQELGSITVDFDRVVAPIASLDLFIEGEKWTSTDTAQICPEAFTMIVADIQNVAIKEYNFYFNGLKVNRANSISNTFIPTFTTSDSIVNIKLEVVTQADCTFKDVDSLVVRVSNGIIDGTPLIAENNYPEYCDGEVGVRLAYLMPRKGEIYRLYKVGEFEDELLDIQEIPSYYMGVAKDTLWLSGWGDNITLDYKAYAKAGEYYVTVESEDGCTLESNRVVVIENPLPVTDTTKVYFAHTYKNSIDEWEVDTTTVSEEYGLLDTGHLILDNAQKGVTYTLYHVETEAELQVKKASNNGERLIFGPIISYKEPEPEDDNTVQDSTVVVPSDSSLVVPTDSLNNLPSDVETIGLYNKAVVSPAPEDWGEGIYTIIATNDSTGCTTEIGNVEFVEEQLVAYDVYLFMNKNQSIVKQSLYPKYPNKGNHKYIDWRSKIDVVWSPKVDQSADGTYTIVEEENTEDYEVGSGYSKTQSKSNIVFELLPTMKDSTFAVFDTLNFEKPVEGCDSLFAYSSYKYFTMDSIGFDTLTSTVIDTLIYHPTFVEGCDSTEIKHYSYFKVDHYTDTVKVPAGTWGCYGFDSFTGSQDYDLASMSGMFVYAKRPTFYGQEILRYRIYNKKMPSVRFSNEAKITILCGNQDSGDSATVFLIPNVLSPNGDGLNDDFKILLPYNYSDSESKLEVFNRWGTLVYRSSGTQYGGDCYGGVTPVDPATIWDGTSKTSNMLTVGKKLPSGTYYYVYTITLVDNNGYHNTKKLSGYIELRH